MSGRTCVHCGGVIALSDDGSRWIHVHGYGWRVSCGLVATPALSPGDGSDG